MTGTALTARSMLFVPGGRPELLAKVARCRPDVVVADLEDAVAPSDKEQAREATLAALRSERPEAGMVLVRVNPPGTPWHEAELAAVAGAASDRQRPPIVDGVVLPKYERVEQLEQLRAVLPPATHVVVGLETALGIADVRVLLSAEGTIPPSAAYFGAEDLILDMAGRRTRQGHEVLYARSRVCLAARLAGVPSIDQAVVAVRDTEHFRADAEQARDLGYHGKICLHPDQVTAVHEIFTTTAEDVGHAHQVLAAAAAGVGVVDGQMVDAAHVAMARSVLARSGTPTADPPAAPPPPS